MAMQDDQCVCVNPTGLADSGMSLFVDTQRSIPLTEQLYQAAREATACYMDDTMSDRVTVYVTGELLGFVFLSVSGYITLPPSYSLAKAGISCAKSQFCGCNGSTLPTGVITIGAQVHVNISGSKYYFAHWLFFVLFVVLQVRGKSGNCC